jgi:hypothetical protein
MGAEVDMTDTTHELYSILKVNNCIPGCNGMYIK